MYIVAERVDYEDVILLSAHETRQVAQEAAERRVATYVDPWDMEGTRQDVRGAGDLGPATRTVAAWRIYDLRTILVCEVVVTPAKM